MEMGICARLLETNKYVLRAHAREPIVQIVTRKLHRHIQTKND